MEAYSDCFGQIQKYNAATKNTTTAKFDWVAFFDVDEFLVLKQHDRVTDMLQEYCPKGGLSVNWRLFRDSHWNLYSPQPVTKRFLFYNGGTNMHTKTIARIDDIDSVKTHSEANPHNFLIFKDDNLTMKDSNGKHVDGPFNKEGPTDVLVLHHYNTKSAKEMVMKTSRGRAATKKKRRNLNQTKIFWENALARTERVPNDYALNDPEFTFDDSAWQFLKKKVPAYALFDEIFVS